MKFLIELEAKDQPGLLEQLKQCEARFREGGAFLNVVSSSGSVKMGPATDSDENEYRRQHALAHPRPAAAWRS